MKTHTQTHAYRQRIKERCPWVTGVRQSIHPGQAKVATKNIDLQQPATKKKKKMPREESYKK